VNVHRKQITFDDVDDDGLVHSGEIRPATRKTLRGWLGEHCPSGDAEFAVEGRFPESWIPPRLWWRFAPWAGCTAR